MGGLVALTWYYPDRHSASRYFRGTVGHSRCSCGYQRRRRPRHLVLFTSEVTNDQIRRLWESREYLRAQTVNLAGEVVPLISKSDTRVFTDHPECVDEARTINAKRSESDNFSMLTVYNFDEEGSSHTIRRDLQHPCEASHTDFYEGGQLVQCSAATCRALAEKIEREIVANKLRLEDQAASRRASTRAGAKLQRAQEEAAKKTARDLNIESGAKRGLWSDEFIEEDSPRKRKRGQALVGVVL